MAASDFAVMRFSTGTLPERQRVAMMREFYGPLVARVDAKPATEGPFFFEATARALPGLTVVNLVSSPVHLRRDRMLLANGDDRVTLSITLSGGGRIAQVGRELARTAGSGFLCSHADEFESTITGMSNNLNISIPRKVLSEKVPRFSDHFLRPIAPQSEALRLLVNYVELLEHDHTLGDGQLRGLIVNHVHDLVAMTLGASREAAEIARGRGLRAARLHAVKTDILNSLAAPDLSISAIAARHGVTPRYVQVLFEQERTTFSVFLLEQRLARVHGVLRDQMHRGRSISAIAFDTGFGDLSHFNRAFRRRYGATPSDVRAAVGRGSA